MVKKTSKKHKRKISKVKIQKEDEYRPSKEVKPENEASKSQKESTNQKITPKKNIPTLNLKRETDIAMDFATKVYKTFNKIVKSIILFGSTMKQSAGAGSDIDIIIIIDDVSIKWDQELIAWYREELGKIMKLNPYPKAIHINTIKLSTWWEDLIRGDPVIINVIRYGESIIDMGGFFEPLKFLLLSGKIRSTPEAVYSNLQRAPLHLARSKVSELNSIEGLYWAMVDSAQAALISAKIIPPSPEHIPSNLKEVFADQGKLKIKYITDFRDLHYLHKQISHGEITDLKGVEIDKWQERTEDFMKVMGELVREFIEK